MALRVDELEDDGFNAEFPDGEPVQEEDVEPEILLDEESANFVHDLIMRCIQFMEYICDEELYPYQREPAYRLIESIILNDGSEITVLMSRQAGKSTLVADVIASLMVLLPRLAKTFDMLSMFRKGFWVGVFGPIAEQAETIWGRVKDRLQSERAKEVMADPEIDDEAKSGGPRTIKLKESGSFCRYHTANPKAKIESKSYQWLVLDEAQDIDDYVAAKSIFPMGAHYNAGRVLTGTPTRTKNLYYKAIQRNKRADINGRKRKSHFEYNWRVVSKYNPKYKSYVEGEMRRLGPESDEFLLSYECKWLLERGMFTTEDSLEDMLDTSMQMVKAWWQTPVIVGIDPARTKDSTVVTVLWVNWDVPDEFGYYDTRILNWLEIHNEEWERQYFEIVQFLDHYNIWAVAVDAQGVGGAVAERLKLLLAHRGCEVHLLGSDQRAQHERWTHLSQMLERGKVIIPGHSKARRLRVWKKFYQQMVDLEKVSKGPFILAQAPEEEGAYDDYPDSLALACVLTKDVVTAEAEQFEAPWHSGRSR